MPGWALFNPESSQLPAYRLIPTFHPVRCCTFCRRKLQVVDLAPSSMKDMHNSHASQDAHACSARQQLA